MEKKNGKIHEILYMKKILNACHFEAFTNLISYTSEVQAVLPKTFSMTRYQYLRKLKMVVSCYIPYR